jgi:AbrB family looped-hinge helix DNA binding protein
VSKVTSKLQVTVPKAIADRYRIRPGDDVEWVPAGDTIRVVPKGRQRSSDDRRLRLRRFDEATKRQLARQAGLTPEKEPLDRGWKREDLYERARPR